jgi:hypothetical protein
MMRENGTYLFVIVFSAIIVFVINVIIFVVIINIIIIIIFSPSHHTYLTTHNNNPLPLHHDRSEMKAILSSGNITGIPTAARKREPLFKSASYIRPRPRTISSTYMLRLLIAISNPI